MRISHAAGWALGILTAAAMAVPAHAQATRTWVSGVGDDANPCSRTAPCKTFPGAISKTFINGEITCLDSGGFGTVTITKSITIDCKSELGGILASGVSGIIVNIPAGNANDPLRTVRLRGLSINGTGASGTVGTRTGLRGIHLIAAQSVYVENSVISDFSQQGILDLRTGGQTRLYVTDTVIRNNAGPGIALIAAPTNIVVLARLRSENNQIGVVAGNGSNVLINRSVMSGNSSAGVQADPGAQVNVNNTTISHNNTGVLTTGTVRLSNNDIAFNNQAFNGNTTSFGNNRLSGNVGLGTAPTAAGGATPDLGQQ